MIDKDILQYVDRFKLIFELLKNKTDVKEVREKFEDDIDDIVYVYKRIKERNDYSNLPEKFQAYFALDDNLGCKYFFNDGLGGGEFNLRWVCRLLKLDDYDEELGYEGQPEEEAKLFKTFRVIDSHPEAGDNKWGVISLVEGYSPPNEPPVYFVDRGRAFDMNMQYGDYLDALLETYAIYNWQYLYCDIDLSENSEFSYVYNSLDKGIKGLSSAFPDKDFSKLRMMLEAKR